MRNTQNQFVYLHKSQFHPATDIVTPFGKIGSQKIGSSVFSGVFSGYNPISTNLNGCLCEQRPIILASTKTFSFSSDPLSIVSSPISRRFTTLGDEILIRGGRIDDRRDAAKTAGLGSSIVPKNGNKLTETIMRRREKMRTERSEDNR